MRLARPDSAPVPAPCARRHAPRRRGEGGVGGPRCARRRAGHQRAAGLLRDRRGPQGVEQVRVDRTARGQYREQLLALHHERVAALRGAHRAQPSRDARDRHGGLAAAAFPQRDPGRLQARGHVGGGFDRPRVLGVEDLRDRPERLAGLGLRGSHREPPGGEHEERGRHRQPAGVPGADGVPGRRWRAHRSDGGSGRARHDRRQLDGGGVGGDGGRKVATVRIRADLVHPGREHRDELVVATTGRAAGTHEARGQPVDQVVVGPERRQVDGVTVGQLTLEQVVLEQVGIDRVGVGHPAGRLVAVGRVPHLGVHVVAVPHPDLRSTPPLPAGERRQEPYPGRGRPGVDRWWTRSRPAGRFPALLRAPRGSRRGWRPCGRAARSGRTAGPSRRRSARRRTACPGTGRW